MTRGLQTALRPATSTEATEGFAADVVAGLAAKPKRLPAKYFYDSAGSALFEQITRLPEYYPTRCELALLQQYAPAMASFFPSGCALIEFGSGSSRKARILLRPAASVEAYVPVDISGDFLREDAARLRRDFPHLSIIPVVADFTAMSGLPAEIAPMARAGFFPGSTIGNFEPHEACAFLRRAAGILGPGSVLIVGIDLEKAPDILYRAYNDAEGVTAQFNLNLLVRINRELGGNFDLGAFEHHAFYNAERHRIEMHLASTRRQRV
ncbi:MAG TPA: L-histidine N(alpha)-methyltransferase, partial [Xanthobacteraceae bacterium]|nr:L-histidine N(alpha)-methyltransferase [Xanthobacteraceae bacterium]